MNEYVPVHVFREELLDIASRRQVAVQGSASAELTAAVAAAVAVQKTEKAIADTAGSDDSFQPFAAMLTGLGRVIGNPSRSLRPERTEKLKTLSDALKAAVCNADAAAAPTTRFGLVGLALSGGGIRSAVFNFGLLQALAARGMLRHVDYLSTVSGGGYIGGCLTSVLSNPAFALDPVQFPFRRTSGQAESPTLRRVRQAGRYLAPGGLVDRARIPSLVFIGIVVNLLIIVPYLMIAACLTRWVYGGWLTAYREAGAQRESLLIGRGLLDVLGGRLDPGQLVWRWVDNLRDWLSSQVFGVPSWPQVADIPLYAPTLALGALLSICVVVFPVIRRVARRSWNLRNATENGFTLGLVLLALTITLNTLPLAVAVYDRGVRWPGITQTIVTALTALAPFLFAARTASGVSSVRQKVVIYVLGLITPAVLVMIYVQLAYWLVLHEWDRSMFIAALVLIALTWRLFDVNLTSMHSFYRDRLSKAFLFKLDASSNVVANDDQKLSTLNKSENSTERNSAPYHLINATLNLQGSDAQTLRRHSDFFLFSRRFCGSERTDYCRTGDLELADPGLNLGTAIAISGAALAPNRGTGTVRSLVSVMTLLNARTGYWLPNPKFVKSASVHLARLQARLLWTGVGPLYFIYEMLGRLNEHRKYVNVSDGGHLENLGVYELLRRRCQFIVVCDAEEDSKLTFNGLGKLIRYAKIDYGIAIQINLDDLRRNASGLSGGHFAVGTIRYTDTETGLFLYIKASLTGDEGEEIKEYQARHADFPHEPTGQQFFNEGQFEVYRALGEHIGTGLFERVLPGVDTQATLASWCEELVRRSQQRYPRDADIRALEHELNLIEHSFQDPALAEYTAQLYPELELTEAEATRNVDAIERWRRIFHVCHRQLRFMESVFVGLSLQETRNRHALVNLGYLALFNRWARAPRFRAAAAAALGSCSPAFQVFCSETLDLQPAVWDRGNVEEFSARERTALAAAAKIEDDTGRRGALVGPDDQVWIAERRYGAVTRRLATAVVRRSAVGDAFVATLTFFRLEGSDELVLNEVVPILKAALCQTMPGVSAVRYVKSAIHPLPTRNTAFARGGWQPASTDG